MKVCWFVLPPTYHHRTTFLISSNWQNVPLIGNHFGDLSHQPEKILQSSICQLSDNRIYVHIMSDIETYCLVGERPSQVTTFGISNQTGIVRFSATPLVCEYEIRQTKLLAYQVRSFFLNTTTHSALQMKWKWIHS